MATRLQEISCHWLAKTAAFILVVVSFGCFAALSHQIVVKYGLGGYSFEEYISHNISSVYNSIANMFDLKSEEYIKSEAYLIERPWLAEEDSQSLADDRMRSLRMLGYAKTKLAGLENIYYYATDGAITIANCDMTTAEEFKRFKYYDVIDGYSADLKITTESYYHGDINILFAGNKKVYLAYDDTFIIARQAEFVRDKEMLQKRLPMAAVFFLLGIFFLIFLVMVAGVNAAGELKMLPVDRLWTEASLFFIGMTIVGYLIFAVQAPRYYDAPAIEVTALFIVISAFFCSIGLTLLLSLVRKIKNKSFFNSSLVYMLWGKVRNILSTILNLTPLNVKIIFSFFLCQAVTFAGAGIMVGHGGGGGLFAGMLALMVTLAVLGFIIRYVLKPYDDEVADRLQASLAKEMRAEKLKTELITNVSHDLKTPLTSIINYADLLLKQDEGNEYARIIWEKGQKLKDLTEDLFEVSKAQSGNMPVHLEKLDVGELIEQILAEFDEPVVEFKVNAENAAIIADGKLMSRVLENLIGNVNKYALTGTRAYIDAFEREGATLIVVKNIANYEMNFDAGQITERFSRGDQARSGGGSGLGLAIAQSYTEACGGKMTVDVDGDLFKVSIQFPRAGFY